MVSIEPGNREGPPINLTEPRDIVVIGASRGGVEALKGIVAALPPSLQSALFIVLHISPTHASLLPDVLSRAGPLPAEHGRDGTRVETDRADCHVMVRRRHVNAAALIRLDQGPTLAEEATPEPPLPAETRSEHNLPVRLTRLIGRLFFALLDAAAAIDEPLAIRRRRRGSYRSRTAF